MIEDLRLAAKLVLEKCVERGLTACAAESCTGGLVASSIVAEPHASRFFLGSAVVYCDAAKERILKVKDETIERHFAESPECAREMAEGAARLFGADISVSTTGFLDGNTGNRPAILSGNVFLSVCVRNRENGGFNFDSFSLMLDPERPRNENREKAALAALNLLLSKL